MGLLFVVAAAVGGVVVAWRRNPRVGSGFVNTVVNPGLLQRGLVGGRTSEIGTIEHVGRITGVRRLTPVHPEVTPGGFRIMVPLGPHSQWARNVLIAGHCRLQLHGVVYDLDEPAMISASDLDGLPTPVRIGLAAIGFQYLTLRTFDSRPGTLEPPGLEVSVLPDEPGQRSNRREGPAPALAGSSTGG